MRDQFYGDRRDLWKWTITLDEAGDRKIIYVAMFRPDDKPHVPQDVRPDVREFFFAEWKELHRSRNCSRIQRLSNRIVLFLDDYKHTDAAEYFKRVCQHLESRTATEQFLVLVDPDTGIRTKPSPKHVSFAQLGSVWEAMRQGDKLLIYQHHAREKREKWIAEKRSNFANAGISETSLTQKHHSDVCFFCAAR